MKNLLTLLFTVLSATAFAQLNITEAKLGKEVSNRELTGESASFTKGEKAYLWLKTSGGTGALTVTFTNGSHTSTRNLTASGNPWRTWAYVTAYYTGTYTVTVADEKGTSLKELTFTVQ